MSFPGGSSAKSKKAIRSSTEMSALKLFLLAVSIAFILTGCATTEPENQAERPWNSQRGWEHGLPGNMTPRR
jgi:hypothetical protein